MKYYLLALGIYTAFGVAEATYQYWWDYREYKVMKTLGCKNTFKFDRIRPTILILNTILVCIARVWLWPLFYRYKDSWKV